MSLLKKTQPPVLDAARVEALQADIADYITAKALAIKEGRDGESPCEGIPIQVIENILRGRRECACAAFLHIVKNSEA
jgi:hypothetical protein